MEEEKIIFVKGDWEEEEMETELANNGIKILEEEKENTEMENHEIKVGDYVKFKEGHNRVNEKNIFEGVCMVGESIVSEEDIEKVAGVDDVDGHKGYIKELETRYNELDLKNDELIKQITDDSIILSNFKKCISSLDADEQFAILCQVFDTYEKLVEYGYGNLGKEFEKLWFEEYPDQKPKVRLEVHMEFMRPYILDIDEEVTREEYDDIMECYNDLDQIEKILDTVGLDWDDFSEDDYNDDDYSCEIEEID